MLSQVLLGLALSLLILLTICGNVLVCLAVCATRRLRSVTNCFIVSLAITDLLLAALVLPFSALLEITGKWPLGAIFCNIYISLDVMLCTASILNLLAISMDRYFAVTAPLRYPTLVLPRRVAMAMAAIWLVSVGVSFVPIHLGWNTADLSIQNLREDDSDQDCRFELNPTYALVDACTTFYLPLIVMCWSYHHVFRIARTQAKRIIATRQNSSSSALSAASSPGATMMTIREHKATVTLAVVLGAFVICWFPYFTFFTVMGLRQERNPPRLAYSVVLWLGYANSALNPLLYAALNRDFRSAYARLLCSGRAFTKHTAMPAMTEAGGLMCGHGRASCGADIMTRSCFMMQEMDNELTAHDTNGTAITMVTAVTNGNSR
ncbi:histamine receptor H2a [Chanos chanos]|uniref:Histamine H2 receptor n=1 Tax=Chanos chanos TaxID=29144 RepID=A0A6J2UPP5_CHACN|nr:histamine H2 receptor [Chanos chanos]